MSTARKLRLEDNPAQTIVIDSTFVPSPKACIISGTGTLSVTFNNTSGSEISIEFIAPVYPVGQIVFNDATIPDQQQNLQNPQVADASVNYNVVANGTTHGPYAIQVGDGPMYISITSLDSSPDPIVVPLTGTLLMYSNDAGVTYNVRWPNFNPFPGLTEAYPGVANNSPYTESGPALPYDYSITVKNMFGVGGGTIKIH